MLMAEGEPPSLPPCTTVLPQPPRAIVSCPFRHARRLWSSPVLWMAACRGSDARDGALWGACVSALEALVPEGSFALFARARARPRLDHGHSRPPSRGLHLCFVSACRVVRVGRCGRLFETAELLENALDEIDVTGRFLMNQKIHRRYVVRFKSCECSRIRRAVREPRMRAR